MDRRSFLTALVGGAAGGAAASVLGRCESPPTGPLAQPQGWSPPKANAPVTTSLEFRANGQTRMVIADDFPAHLARALREARANFLLANWTAP